MYGVAVIVVCCVLLSVRCSSVQVLLAIAGASGIVDNIFVGDIFVDDIIFDALFVDGIFVDAIFADAIFVDAIFVDDIFVDDIFGILVGITGGISTIRNTAALVL